MQHGVGHASHTLHIAAEHDPPLPAWSMLLLVLALQARKTNFSRLILHGRYNYVKLTQ